MDFQEIVREAVRRARERGVVFSDGDPIFRPVGSNNPDQFSITIRFNLPAAGGGNLTVTVQRDEVMDQTPINLANRFITIFNDRNFGQELDYID